MVGFPSLAFALHLSTGTHAFAQTPDAPLPHAQILFDEARQLMEHGAFAEACPKLRESFRMDPATGTLLNLAFCLENQGTTAAAYRTYQAAQQRAVDEGNEERSLFAAARLKILESKLVRIVFPESSREPGFWAQCDGEHASLLGTVALCVVEPGQHRLIYGAPGKMPNALQVDTSEPGGEFVVRLRSLVPVGPVRRVSITDDRRPAPLPAAIRPAGIGDATAATISFGIAAIGAASTAYLGWRAKSEWDERNGYCSSGCDERGVAAGQRAIGFAWAANIAGAVTLLSAGVGTYLLVRPKPTGAATVFTGALTADQRGAMLIATFLPEM